MPQMRTVVQEQKSKNLNHLNLILEEREYPYAEAEGEWAQLFKKGAEMSHSNKKPIEISCSSSEFAELTLNTYLLIAYRNSICYLTNAHLYRGSFGKFIRCSFINAPSGL